ncbi:S8 family serine peptidase [Costertonia aggregata]|nr:S8 family serine peptidase [Costertonia aggregata]
MLSITSKMEKEHQTAQKQMLRLATANNWKISERLTDGGYVELQEVGPDGTPLYYTTLTDKVSTVSRANTLYYGGALDLGVHGEGMNIGVWDAGIALTSHQEFGNRVNILDTNSKIESHATMVTGALVSSGVKRKAQGVAHKANAITGDWRRDKIEVSEAAANGLLISNHSYGIQTSRVPDWYFGSYIKVSQDWDNIMYNAPYYLMVTAAGNSQKKRDNDTPVYGKNTDGFDLLLGFNTSKNGIVVAAADTQMNNSGSIKDATVATYSSLGPIDDGRIKPDLAGSGNSMYTANSSGNSAYMACTGTSIAAPGISGSLLLLQQYHEKLYGSFMKAATLKGLALHTADDVNAPGPDYKMGWGIMNTKKAAEALTDKDFSALISEETLKEGETYSITVNASKNQLMSASISWTDAAGEYVNRGVLNDTKAALTNDLDIRITKDGKTYFPWKLNAAQASSDAITGDNTVDPFERIDVTNASGTYTITVSHKGKLLDQKQDFTIILTGIAVTGCSADTPEYIQIVEPTNSIVPLEWEPMEDAIFEVQYKTDTENSWNTSYVNENSINLQGLEIGNTYEVRLRTICTENIGSEYSETVSFIFNGAETVSDNIIENETFSIDDELAFSVYPNPAVEQIRLEGNISDIAQYNIITMAGVTVKKGNAKNAEINVSDLSSGLYILSIQSLEGVKSTKFYKN